MHPYSTGFRLYKHRWHVLVTLAVVVAPLLFFYIFAEAAHLASGQLLLNVLISLVRITASFAIAASIGWLLGVLFYKGKAADVGLPVFDVLQSFPTFAILPLAVHLWGASEKTIIFFLVITMLWPIFFTVVSTMKLVRGELSEAVEVIGLSGWSYVRHYVWPASLPGLITGSIIGIGEGWEALVATEIIVGTRIGLGDFFKVNEQNTVLTSFGVLGLLVLIFSLNKLVWLPLLAWTHRRNEE